MDQRPLQQGHADTKNDPANRLAASGLRIDNTTHIEDPKRAMNSHQTQIPVHADLDELCAERIYAVIVGCAHPIDFTGAGHFLESVSVQDCGVSADSSAHEPRASP